MLVKSYQAKLRPQNSRIKVVDGQPVAQFPGGPVVGKVQDYDDATGEGVVILHKPVHYSKLEELGISWSAFIGYE